MHSDCIKLFIANITCTALTIFSEVFSVKSAPVLFFFLLFLTTRNFNLQVIWSNLSVRFFNLKIHVIFFTHPQG